MKKLALSLAVLAASGIYVWQQSGTRPQDNLLDANAPAQPAPAADVPLKSTEPADAPRLVHTSSVTPDTPEPAWSTFVANAPKPVQAESVPAVATRPEKVVATPASLTVAASAGGFADGTYTGPAVDAYYGVVQVQAIVQGGRLSSIKILQYPSDRRTSVAINRQALPMLRDEVISAQTANVDIISGATLTSEAFINSLSRALRQATTT